MTGTEQKVREILAIAGVVPNGSNPWDPQIKNVRVYDRVLAGGSLAAGESYMDGWWDVDDLAELFNRLLSAKIEKKLSVNIETIWYFIRATVLNLQDKQRARQVVEEHYNLDNDLYMSFLDPYNQYTCGYFKNTDDLNLAQEQKLKLICDKLQLKPTDRVLDVGCGWGGFAKYAAEHYGCHVTGISISEEQIAYATEFTKGLPVTIKYLDYRDLAGEFDKVLVCGMIEHVGYKNYRTIMQVVHRVLTNDGLFLLHTIGGDLTLPTGDSWLNKYIFPNGMLPSPLRIGRAIEGLFVLEDWHNFGPYYDKTLMAWFKNFDAAWPRLKSKYSERFYRMWKYYFLMCAGTFRARPIHLWQIVLSKNGVRGGYQSVR